MNISPIHQTPADKLAASSQGTLSAVQAQTSKMEEMTQAMRELVAKEKPETILNLSGVAQAIGENKAKLEEIKSAVLANTIAIKKLATAISAIPQTDLQTTNDLLKALLVEMKKPAKVSLKLI